MIVKAHLKGKNFEKAIQVTKKMTRTLYEPQIKSKTQVDIVNAYLEQGMLDEARDFVKKIPSKKYKSEAQLEIVKAYMTKNSKDKAIEVKNEMPDHYRMDESGYSKYKKTAIEVIGSHESKN